MFRLLRKQGESLPDGRVRWLFRSSQTGQPTHVGLTPEELIRRFLQHILPQFYCRVRCFGWFHLAAQVRLNRVRALLRLAAVLPSAKKHAWKIPDGLLPVEPPPLPAPLARAAKTDDLSETVGGRGGSALGGGGAVGGPGKASSWASRSVSWRSGPVGRGQRRFPLWPCLGLAHQSNDQRCRCVDVLTAPGRRALFNYGMQRTREIAGHPDSLSIDQLPDLPTPAFSTFLWAVRRESSPSQTKGWVVVKI
jgi:hypothetical protein